MRNAHNYDRCDCSVLTCVSFIIMQLKLYRTFEGIPMYEKSVI